MIKYFTKEKGLDKYNIIQEFLDICTYISKDKEIKAKNLMEILDSLTLNIKNITNFFNSSLNNIFDNLKSLSLESLENKNIGNEMYKTLEKNNNLYNYPEENIKP